MGQQDAQGTRWQVLAVVALITIWEGFPFLIFGMPPATGFQLYTALVFGGVLLFICRALLRGRVSLTVWEAMPLLLFLWCGVVSYNWSIIARTSAAEILLGLPTVAPLLTVFLLTAIGTTRRDAERGLYYSAVLASSLAIFDTTMKLGILDVYARGSEFTESHIVFFKVVSAFGLIVAIVQSANARSISEFLVNMIGALLTGYNVIVLIESRLLSIGVFLALPIIWFLVFRGGRKIVTGILAPLAVLPAAIFFVSAYLGNFQSLDQYLEEDRSAQFRAVEHEYFANIFSQSHGMGFGYMSNNQRYDNVVTFSEVWAGRLAGVGDYPVSIGDIGLASALFQFGYVGLALVLVMTVMCAVTMISSHRGGRDYSATCALGALMAMLMLNPISTNFFTLAYSANIGALLWFIASRVGRERAEARQQTAAARAEVEASMQ